MDMNNIVEEHVEKFSKKHQRRMIMSIVLGICAVLVVLLVIWQLHDTGNAATYYCGFEEHTHTEDCYEKVLICGLEESEPSEGHTHTDECYETQKVLVCNQEESDEHTHTDECYEDVQVLVCTLEESEPTEGHTHTDECYEERLICDIPEHVHTEACYSNPSADVEDEDTWEGTLPELTGVWGKDVAAIAESQLGYTESTENYEINDDGEKLGYSRYGAWYGNQYGEWNSMFAAFCIKMAEVLEESFPVNSGAYAWAAELKEANLYTVSAEYTPSVGDVAFFSNVDSEDDADNSSEVRADIVGIVSKVDINDEGNSEIKVIIGDLDDSVAEYSVTVDEKGNSTFEENEDIELLGFGIMPAEDIDENNEETDNKTTNNETDNNDADVENIDNEETDNDNTAEAVNEGTTLSGKNTFEYENKNVVLDVTVDGNVDLNSVADADDEISWDDISMKVTMLDEKDSSYVQMLEWAEENEDGDLYDLTAVQLNFYYGKTELDMSECEVTVKATPTERAISKAMPEQSEEDIIDLGVIYSALEIENNDVEEIDSITITDDDSENAYVTATVSSNLMVTGLSTVSSSNPNFTVQYYANIPMLDFASSDSSGDGVANKVVINTNGGKIPENGTTDLQVIYEQLEKSSTDSSKYQFIMKDTLTEIYDSAEYSYSRHPGVYYTNILQDNSDYSLSEVLVLKSGKSSNSTNDSDWTSYGTDVEFTNIESNANDKTIYITDGTVIRFLYKTEATDKTITGNLFDYNITNTKAYSSASISTSTGTSQSSTSYGQAFWENARKSTTYVYTNRQGINSASNYSNTSNVLYAFGNANTYTTLDTQSWNSNLLNRYNSNGYSGATFGLVKSTEVGNGNLQFSDGISAPALFTADDVTGKEMFNGVSINFSKNGDVYSLDSITSDTYDINLQNLKLFSYYEKYSDGTKFSGPIYSNNFWPLDDVTYLGMDPLFGKYEDSSSSDSDDNSKTSKTYDSSLQCSDGSTSKDFPPSDDSINHNSYFGMFFEIEFTMTDNYCGPLEYFFFGDDDLWIFLTPYTVDSNGNKTYDYNSQKLILDLGGVHSSIGEYVNLWDYIDPGTNGNYVLSVFYTERGASGSSCSMCYTLPSVTSATPVAATGSLNVEKVLTNAAGDIDTTSDKEFTFTLNMVDSDGEEIDDSCDYYIYNSNDDNKTSLSSGSITSGDSFTLKGGQCIQIDYIPCGTVCTVTENDDDRDGYSTTYVVNGGSTQVGASAGGSIVDDGDSISIVFTNSTSISLPYTGGEGIYMYIAAGFLLICIAGKLMYKNYKRKKA